MLRNPAVEFQAQAAASLIAIGAKASDAYDGVGEALLDGMSHDEMYLPTALLAWSRANPAQARLLLGERFRHGNALQRESIAFVAGTLGDSALLEVVEQGRNDPSPRVRAAVSWAVRQG
jgi:hypothetical protein